MQLSSLIDNDSKSQMMFDHADLERSKFYFKMLQILRILNNGLDDLKSCMESIPAFWFETLLLRLMNVHCSYADICEVQVYWTRLSALTMQKFNALDQRTKAKKSEIESLRDGVSGKSRSVVACHMVLTSDVSSCSTQPQSVRRCKPDAQTRIF
jgi:hypothetical protein